MPWYSKTGESDGVATQTKLAVSAAAVWRIRAGSQGRSVLRSIFNFFFSHLAFGSSLGRLYERKNSSPSDPD